MNDTLNKKIFDLFVERRVALVQSVGPSEHPGLEHALLNVCESEIERRMLIELVFAGYVGMPYQQICVLRPQEPIGQDGLFLCPQFRWLGYRSDIAVILQQGGFAALSVMVECDGHEFHEKTKEQAARDKKRDRDIQAEGVFVLRFTGSEIYRRGKECAAEVAKIVNERVVLLDQLARK